MYIPVFIYIDILQSKKKIDAQQGVLNRLNIKLGGKTKQLGALFENVKKIFSLFFCADFSHRVESSLQKIFHFSPLGLATL